MVSVTPTFMDNLLVSLKLLCLGQPVSSTYWGKKQNGQHFADNILYYIFLNGNQSKLLWISLKFVSMGPWWRHQMETFSVLLAFCAGNSPVHGEFPEQKPVTRSFDVFFDLRLNKRLSKQSWGWWSETPSISLWRHRNATWWKVSIGAGNGLVPNRWWTSVLLY